MDNSQWKKHCTFCDVAVTRDGKAQPMSRLEVKGAAKHTQQLGRRGIFSPFLLPFHHPRSFARCLPIAMFASQLVLAAALVSSASAALTVLTPNANTWWGKFLSSNLLRVVFAQRFECLRSCPVRECLLLVLQ